MEQHRLFLAYLLLMVEAVVEEDGHNQQEVWAVLAVAGMAV